MGENVCMLTRAEAEYLLRLGTCVAKVMAATETGGRVSGATERLADKMLSCESGKSRSVSEGTLDVSDDDQVVVSCDDRNTFSVASSILELLVREKKSVLRDTYGLTQVAMSREEILAAAEEIKAFAKAQGIDTAELGRRLRAKQRVPARKLYIADLHFFHGNLNREMDCRGFADADAMNAHMIKRWNESVNARDEVFILGDFALGRGPQVSELLHSLKGRKYLIEGNHDRFVDEKGFDRSLFEWILPYAEIRDNKRKVVLSHYPIVCYNGQYRRNSEHEPITYMMYGHVHDTHDERLVDRMIRMARETYAKAARTTGPEPIPCQMINCFCMYTDYAPKTLDEWIRIDAERRAKLSNEQRGPLVDR